MVLFAWILFLKNNIIKNLYCNIKINNLKRKALKSINKKKNLFYKIDLSLSNNFC
jgi:hypothetical protein